MRQIIFAVTAFSLLASPVMAAAHCRAGGKFIKCPTATTTPAAANTMAPTTAMAPMTPQNRMRACAAKWKAMSDADKKATTYKAFSATCLKKA